MIQGLRKKHLFVFTILAAFLPITYVAGLAARSLPQPTKDFPSALRDDIPTTSYRSTKIETHWSAYWIETRLLKNETLSVLELNVLETIQMPDLLLYWSATPATDSTLPGNAFLLGSISASGTTHLTAPAANGYLYIYSLGHQEIISSTEYTL